MSKSAKRLTMRRVARPGIASALILAGVLFASDVRADGDAIPILKSMTDYMAKQKTISAKFDTDIEVITPELQKIQFASSSELTLSRPDKLRVHRTGGYADVEFLADGKTFSIYGKNINAVAQVDFQGSVDQLVDKLRSEFHVEAPGADLLLTHSFEGLTSDVIDAKHIGRGVIDGIECEHLAFRGSETDWQIWIEVGANPVPRKYVITSKAVTGGPQYTLRINDWKTNVQLAADAFTLKPAADATKVEFSKLSGIDEVPGGVPAGAKK